MNLDHFFAVASPTTLASLCADIDQAWDTGSQFPGECWELRKAAWDVLCANVGRDEADKLYAEQRGGVVKGGAA